MIITTKLIILNVLMSCPKHIMASQIRELVRIASNKVIYQRALVPHPFSIMKDRVLLLQMEEASGLHTVFKSLLHHS